MADYARLSVIKYDGKFFLTDSKGATRLATDSPLERPSFFRLVIAGSAFILIMVFLMSLTGCSVKGSSSGGEWSSSGKTTSKRRGTKPYTIRGKTYYPMSHARGFRETGIASWYGRDFHGKSTANGERYNMYGMTAAHKTLPLGTIVRVTNRNNGKSIVVRVNDRGPFVSGRVIDLTKTGAEKIGMLAAGTAPVRVEAIGDSIKPPARTPKTPSRPTPTKTSPVVAASRPAHIESDGSITGTFYVQVGAFSSSQNAEGLVSQMKGGGRQARKVEAPNGMWRVQVGPYPSTSEAERIAGQLHSQFPNNFVIADP